MGVYGRLNAILVTPHSWPPDLETNLGIWSHKNSNKYMEALHPEFQVWVHVDYTNYRKAYIEFGLPDFPKNFVLDHIQNRKAIRLRDFSHPFLRLSPISKHVNTNAGHLRGGEGLEKEFLRDRTNQSAEVQARVTAGTEHEIIYADPIDLTKMINVVPGTELVAGVGESLKLFYPAS